MWTREDLAWVAGFFEGEGTVYFRYPNGRVTPAMGIAIPQVQREPLDRVALITGLGKTYGPYKRAENRLPIHQYVIQNWEEVQAFCGLIWNWLSPKRKQEVQKVLIERKRAWLNKPSVNERIVRLMNPLANGCVEWTGWMSEKGQPMFKFSQNPRQEGPVRRYLYQTINGEVPKEAKIGVTCNTPRCVAEEHIYRKGNPANWR